MYERMKAFLHHCISVVVALLIAAAVFMYAGISGLMTTRIVNNLRLDTYITFDTGMGIIMLIFLLGWAPLWVILNSSRRR